MSEEKEYFGRFPKTVLSLPFWGAIIVIVAAVLYSVSVRADPRFQVQHEGVRVVLYDDKCDVSAVTNLPYKATWEEKGKVYQGCWGARPEVGLVMMYFDDKTVGLIPFDSLTKVQGT